MKECYQEVIGVVSNQIAQVFLSNEEKLTQRSTLLDADIAEIMRQLGLETTKIILEKTLNRLVNDKQSEGLVIQRNPPIKYNVIFGQLEIQSPYLWSKGLRAKPLIDEMNITHQGRSEAVNRALADFGSEESFAHAAKRFNEHYKYDIGPSAVYRVTKQIAEEAEDYIENKLSNAGSLTMDALFHRIIFNTQKNLKGFFAVFTCIFVDWQCCFLP